METNEYGIRGEEAGKRRREDEFQDDEVCEKIVSGSGGYERD